MIVPISLRLSRLIPCTGTICTIPLPVGSVRKFLVQNLLVNCKRGVVWRAFSSGMAQNHGPLGAAITSKLTESFKPTHLEVFNESYMHNVPKGSETHFKVVVVSEEFDGVSLIKRHRMVNNALKDELAGGVHALSIQAKAPAQWSQNTSVSQSPPCLGGMAREQASKNR